MRHLFQKLLNNDDKIFGEIYFENNDIITSTLNLQKENQLKEQMNRQLSKIDEYKNRLLEIK